MKKLIIILFALALMEGLAWWVYKSFSLRNGEETTKSPEQAQSSILTQSIVNKAEGQPETSQNSINGGKVVSSVPPTPDSESFPTPSTEVVNGVTERTIHIGVRKWAWDPNAITAKQDELVRLIIHNADVKHGLVIPELGVNQDIPEDGSVVEFMASKRGMFEFFCSVWCGEGHMEMKGKIVIE